MGKVTVYCIISGCTPEIASNLLSLDSEDSEPYGPVVTSALKALADPHELSSQDDLSVIGAIHPSGQPYTEHVGEPDPPVSDLDPDEDIRVLPHCVMGDIWDFGFVVAPPPIKQDWCYLVSYGCHLMVQTYALDIMALATCGRMTPLRLWRLAMEQGFESASRPHFLNGVDYGAITGQWEQVPDEFPGFATTQLMELEKNGDVEIIKQRMVDEGYFWLWMAPDRFPPVAPTKCEYPIPALSEVHLRGSRSAIENLPPEVLMPIVSSLPLRSILNLTSASQSLRVGILGNDYLACIWLYENAPWWIPVPTQTPMKDDQSQPPTTVPRAYLASQWPAQTPMSVGFPVGLDWEYIRRCARSGSMRNRERIWWTALDIEYSADQAGV